MNVRAQSGWLALCLASLIVVVALFKGSWGREEASQDRVAAQAAPIFMALATDPFEDRDDVRRAVQARLLVGQQLASQQQLNELTKSLEDFLTLLFLEESPDPYMEWRRRSGAIMLGMDDLMKLGWDMALAQQSLSELSGEAPPQASDVPGLYRYFWRASRKVGNGANQPVRVASGDGFVSIFKRFTPQDTASPYIETSIGPEFWQGGVGRSGRFWWRESSSLEAILANRGSVLTSHTGCIMEFKNGTRRPMLVFQYWSDDDQRWLIQNVGVTTFSSDEPVWPPEY